MSETCTTLWNGSEMIGGDTAADASNIVYTNAANIRQTVKGALDNGAMIKMPYEEYKSLSEEERNAGVYEVTGCPDSYADRVMLLETQAEYDALTEAEKLNGTSYFVKEGPDQFDAKNIHYSDTTGETTNVGDALSKLNENLTIDGDYKFKVGKDGDGNVCYYGADGSLIPFKSADFSNMETIKTETKGYNETTSAIYVDYSYTAPNDMVVCADCMAVIGTNYNGSCSGLISLNGVSVGTKISTSMNMTVLYNWCGVLHAGDVLRVYATTGTTTANNGKTACLNITKITDL